MTKKSIKEAWDSFSLHIHKNEIRFVNLIPVTQPITREPIYTRSFGQLSSGRACVRVMPLPVLNEVDQLRP